MARWLEHFVNTWLLNENLLKSTKNCQSMFKFMPNLVTLWPDGMHMAFNISKKTKKHFKFVDE